MIPGELTVSADILHVDFSADPQSLVLRNVMLLVALAGNDFFYCLRCERHVFMVREHAVQHAHMMRPGVTLCLCLLAAVCDVSVNRWLPSLQYHWVPLSYAGVGSRAIIGQEMPRVMSIRWCVRRCVMMLYRRHVHQALWQRSSIPMMSFYLLLYQCFHQLLPCFPRFTLCK